MKIKKIFLSFIVSLSLIFSNIFVVPVSASSVPSWLQPIIDVYDSVNDAANITADALKQSFIGALQGAGFIFDAGRVTTQALLDFLRGYNNGQFTNNNTASDQEVIDNASRYFINNTVLTDNSIEYNSNSKNLTVGFANDIINNSGYRYVYTVNLIDNVRLWPDGVKYNALRSLISSKQSDYICCYYDYTGVLQCFSKNVGIVWNNNYNNVFGCRCYNKASWEYLLSSEVYKFNTSSQVFDLVNTGNGSGGAFGKDPNSILTASTIGNANIFFTVGEINSYKMFMSLDDLKAESIGVSPYYVSDKWNNFINSNNSTYTVDSSNSNNITYGDTNNWINNYYTDNGNYPDPTNIQIYIDNNIPPSPTPTPTPTPTPGPDDPSGGGSGGSGGIDLGWLGTLGQLIGQIVSAIGNFFTGVLQGIVNALSSVLGFLSDTISSLGETLPTTFFDFIGAIFGWLPDPMMITLKALFLMMVFVGVISIFRR